jgi:hypothetical protein
MPCTKSVRISGFIPTLLLAFTGDAQAELLLRGTEIVANTATADNQNPTDGQSVAVAPDGSFVVAWTDYGGAAPDTSRPGIRAQRFAIDGTPIAGEFQVNSFTSGTQYRPSVRTFSDGGFIVVWGSNGSFGDDTGRSIQAQRFDASGAAVGMQFQVNTYTSGFQFRGNVEVLSNDGFLVTWDTDFSGAGGGDGSGTSVRAQLYDSSAVPVGEEFQVNSVTAGAQKWAEAAADDGGAFVVVWHSQGSLGNDNSGYSVQGRRFDAAGDPVGEEFQINSYTTGHQILPTITRLGGGNFVVAWYAYETDGGDTSGTNVQRRMLDASGAPVGADLQMNDYPTGDQLRPVTAPTDDGGFLALWYDGDIHSRRFDASGAIASDDLLINTYTTAGQDYASVAALGNGDFVAVWRSTGFDGDSSAALVQLLCDDDDGNFFCDSDEAVSTTTTSSTTTTTMPMAAACPAQPDLGCLEAATAKLVSIETKAGKEKLIAGLKKIDAQTTQAGFGDPVDGNTSVVLCLYDDGDNLVEDLLVDRAGALCAGKACWKATGTKGWGYTDKDASADGVARINFKSGAAGKGAAGLLAKNNSARAQTALPTGIAAGLAGSLAPTMQLHTSEGFCVEAVLDQVKKDDGTRFIGLAK